MDTVDTPTSIDTQIAEYSPTAASLAALQHRFTGIAYDLTTTKGEKEARSARMELRTLRTNLESKRKDLKAPALERSRLIDDEAKRLTRLIVELEQPIDDQIKADEQRKRDARAEREKADRDRMNALHERIAMIRGVAARAVGKPSAEVQKKLDIVLGIEVGAQFQELEAVARVAHEETIATLRELHAQVSAQEQSAARLAQEREDQRKRDADERAAREAEQDRIAAEHKAEADRLAAERKKFDDEQAASRAEQVRIEQEARAQREAADRQARAERDEQDRIARVERAAEQKRLDDAAAALREQQAKAAADQRRIEDAAAETRRVEQHAAEQEERRKSDAATAARTRLQESAPTLLNALIDWKHAEDAKDKARLLKARELRDSLIQEHEAAA